MRIEVRANGAGRGEVLIDGEPQPDVRGVKIAGRVGDLWRVELDLVAEPEFIGEGFRDVTPLDHEGTRVYETAVP